MAKKSDLESGLQGVFWLGLRTFANFLLQLIVTIFLARLLSPSEFGEVAAITILVGLAELFWMMGIGPSIVQKQNLSKEDIVTGNTLNILFGVSIFAVINIFIETWVRLFSISNEKMLFIFSFIFIINSISGVSKSLLQKKLKYKHLSIISFISLLFYVGSSIILAFNGFGAWSLVYSRLLQMVVETLLLLTKEPVSFKLFIYKNSVRELLYFGGGFTIAKVFNYIANNGDYFVVNKTLGKVELGSYSKSYQLLMFPVTMIGTTLDQVLFPLLSKSQENSEKLNRVFVSGTGLIALLSVPVSIVAYICAEDLIFLFLGDQWGNTILPFKIMIAGLFFRIGYKLSDSLIRALGKVYQRAIIQFVYAFSVLISAYIGHFYGISGVAFGVTVSFILNYFLMTALSVYFVGIKPMKLVINAIPALFYGFITLLVCYLLQGLWINVNSYFFSCVIITIVVFTVYFSLFIFSRKRIVSKDLNVMIDQILAQFLLKLGAKKKN